MIRMDIDELTKYESTVFEDIKNMITYCSELDEILENVGDADFSIIPNSPDAYKILFDNNENVIAISQMWFVVNKLSDESTETLINENLFPMYGADYKFGDVI